MRKEGHMAPKASDSILDLIGNTPLLRLRSVIPEGAADVFAKLEYLNPGLSVKDRAALGMVLELEREGRLGPDSVIVEPTAGNTGIGLALVARARGYRVILVVPDGYSREKQEVMRALGGELVLVPMSGGMQAAIARAEEIAAEIPNAVIPQQFVNPGNPNFHYHSTGPEIFEQMEGRIDAVVIGCGSAGTFTGVARYLREHLPNLQCFAVESEGSVLGGGPPGPHRVEGIGNSFVPENFDRSLCCEVIMADDARAFAMARRLAREEGVLAGGSGGANVWAAIQVARRLGPGKRIVTVVPDSAERYLSKGIFNSE
jgi:cysteine synthase A